MNSEAMNATTLPGDTQPTNAELKKAIEAQMTIITEFASFLDKNFPGKGILEKFTGLQMRHPIPPSVYRDPWIAHYGPHR